MQRGCRIYDKQGESGPILLTMENLSNGKARAVIVNSGNANACAPFGIENARREAMAAAVRSMSRWRMWLWRPPA